ncbi:hypothetical protein P3W45_000916, partial [Vairimorpha bombi]
MSLKEGMHRPLMRALLKLVTLRSKAVDNIYSLFVAMIDISEELQVSAEGRSFPVTGSYGTPPCKKIDALSAGYVPKYSSHLGQNKVKRRNLVTHTANMKTRSGTKRANKDEVEPSENLTLRVDEVVTTGASKPHKPVKQKPEQLGRTTPRHKPKVCKIEWKRFIVYNVSELPSHVFGRLKRDCFRRFDIRPLTRARPTLKDLPRLEESLRARVIVDRPITMRNEAKRRAASEGEILQTGNRGLVLAVGRDFGLELSRMTKASLIGGDLNMNEADGSLSILVDEFINSVWESGFTPIRPRNVQRPLDKNTNIVVENRHKDLWMEINGLSDKPVLDESNGTVVHDKKDKEQLWAKQFGLDGVLKVIAMEELPFPKKVMTIVNMGDTREKIAYERVNEIAYENGLLAKEQGILGSWRCTAQIAILYEIENRRSIRDQATFIAFIDCAKAYDKVPQGALLRRLKSIGITGHLLKVIKLLYEDPRMCIRVGSSLSPVFNYYCEMRQ